MSVALILEDLPESQEMLREVAQKAFPDIRIRFESSVAGALKIIGQFQFDLALIDLSLPDGDGVAVVEALASRFPSCVIVVATIFDDDAHLFPALRAGALGYMLKDQTPEQLVTQLKGISEGRPPLSPAIARRLLEHFKSFNERSSSEVAEKSELLSPRESDVVVRLARGISIADIGAELGISRHTVGDHVKNIYRKLNITSRAEAAIKAKNMGLV